LNDLDLNNENIHDNVSSASRDFYKHLTAWTMQAEDYRHRNDVNKIITAKNLESFNADDRHIRQYEQDVIKKYDECVNRIPTQMVRRKKKSVIRNKSHAHPICCYFCFWLAYDAISLSPSLCRRRRSSSSSSIYFTQEEVQYLFRAACAIDRDHQPHYENFRWYNRYREERIRDSWYYRMGWRTQEDIHQRRAQEQKDVEKFYAQKGYTINLDYALENERFYQKFRQSIIQHMKAQEGEQLLQHQKHIHKHDNNHNHNNNKNSQQSKPQTNN
jgi:hypothetical protein